MDDRRKNDDNPLNCPVFSTLNLISGKWKPMIIRTLIERPMRFGQIKKRLSPISQKVLTQQLRELEKDQVVQREVFEEKVLNVTYSLTHYGRSLIPVLEELHEWGNRHFPHFSQR